ncbi:PH domain-containing protein [Geodermatophilus maliterrae]|uniref:PH domain-containing protein n=1 Tax=Geodermatophilus maliterrae TaxID=3162531 RepID=A0ABV3XMG9_9ACTN
MPYPDKLLADDEEVVRHLHPHWTTLFWPVVRALVVVGAGSYLAALVPPGPQQGSLRLLLLAVALVALAVLVGGPVLRWRTTHHVLTTHRLLSREGVRSRRGRDVALSRVTDVSFRQTLRQRLIRSGTLTVESVGDGGPLVLERVPDVEGTAGLLHHLIEEDEERRAWEPDTVAGGHDESPYSTRRY